MPIIGATELQPVNILGQYVQGLEAGRAAKAGRMQEASNALLMQALQSGASEDDLMRMPGGAAVVEQLAKARKERAGASTADIERRMKAADFVAQSAGSFLSDPASLSKDRLAPWVSELAQNGLISQDAAAHFQQMPDDPAKLAQGLQMLRMAGLDTKSQLQQEFTSQDLGGSTRVIATPKFGGGPARVVPGSEAQITALPPEVEEQKARLAGAGAARSLTRIDARTIPETEYGKVVGKLTGERDVAAYEAAANASEALNKVRQTQDLLARGQPVTGAFAEVRNNVNRIKKLVTGRPDQSITDSELLDALLGQEVFTQIQSLGIGARGLDTPAEREYLRQVVAGTRTLDAEALKRMTDIRANVMERAINKFNSRVKGGELDRFFRDSGLPKREIPLPPTPKSSAATPVPAASGTKGKTARGTDYRIIPD